jgi:hypothetical protein
MLMIRMYAYYTFGDWDAVTYYDAKQVLIYK